MPPMATSVQGAGEAALQPQVGEGDAGAPEERRKGSSVGHDRAEAAGDGLPVGAERAARLGAAERRLDQQPVEADGAVRCDQGGRRDVRLAGEEGGARLDEDAGEVGIEHGADSNARVGAADGEVALGAAGRAGGCHEMAAPVAEAAFAGDRQRQRQVGADAEERLQHAVGGLAETDVEVEQVVGGTIGPDGVEADAGRGDPVHMRLAVDDRRAVLADQAGTAVERQRVGDAEHRGGEVDAADMGLAEIDAEGELRHAGAVRRDRLGRALRRPRDRDGSGAHPVDRHRAGEEGRGRPLYRHVVHLQPGTGGVGDGDGVEAELAERGRGDALHGDAGVGAGGEAEGEADELRPPALGAQKQRGHARQHCRQQDQRQQGGADDLPEPQKACPKPI
jgi:hypothetical protein